jgi:hypothetical protein
MAANAKTLVERAKKRAVKNAKKLPLEASDEVWTFLPEWAGFQAGPAGDLSSGEIAVSVGGDSMGSEETGPEQQAAYALLTKKTKQVQSGVLDAIASSMSELTRGCDMELPKKVDKKALQSLVSLTTAHIHWAHRDGVAYVGYELSCAWDDEHGVGVMTHGDRIVKVGSADTAILGWVARADKGPKKSKARSTSRSKVKAAAKVKPVGKAKAKNR